MSDIMPMELTSRGNSMYYVMCKRKERRGFALRMLYSSEQEAFAEADKQNALWQEIVSDGQEPFHVRQVEDKNQDRVSDISKQCSPPGDREVDRD